MRPGLPIVEIREAVMDAIRATLREALCQLGGGIARGHQQGRKVRSRGSVSWITAAVIAVAALFSPVPAHAQIGATPVRSITDSTDLHAYSFASATYSNNVLYIAFTSTSCASGTKCGVGTDIAPKVASVTGAGLTFTEIGIAGGLVFSTNGRRIQAWRAMVSSGANLSHLDGQWCGAAYTKDPTARATFGVARGANEVIFVRDELLALRLAQSSMFHVPSSRFKVRARNPEC